jgi:hypothetical protein
MKGKISLFIIIAMMLATFAGAQSQTQTQELQTMPAPKLTVSKRGTPVVNLKGTGDQTTQAFDLKQGEATFDMLLDWDKRDPDLAPGEGKFEVVLLNEQGREVENVIGTIGHFDGARTVKVSKAGKYKVKVTAPGPWTISIEQ